MDGRWDANTKMLGRHHLHPAADAQIALNTANAISLGNGANINLQSGASVINNVASGNGTSGLWSAGYNTIEFDSNGSLTIGNNASVKSKGDPVSAEAVNVVGIGNTNTVLSGGLIYAKAAATL